MSNEIVVIKGKLSREQYKTIKQYSRAQMADFLYRLYATAAEDTIQKISSEKIFMESEFCRHFNERIQDVKGIGKERQKLLLALIKDIFKDMKDMQEIKVVERINKNV